MKRKAELRSLLFCLVSLYVCVMSKHNIIIFWLSRSITLQHIPFPCFIFRDLKTKNIDLQFYNMPLVNGINSARTFRIFMFADFTYYLFLKTTTKMRSRRSFSRCVKIWHNWFSIVAVNVRCAFVSNKRW